MTGSHDRQLLIVLAAIHAAILVAIPIAVWTMTPILVELGRGEMLPAFFAAAGIAEIVLALRLRGVLRHIRE